MSRRGQKPALPGPDDQTADLSALDSVLGGADPDLQPVAVEEGGSDFYVEMVNDGEHVYPEALLQVALGAARKRGAGGRIIVAVAINPATEEVQLIDNAESLAAAVARAGELIQFTPDDVEAMPFAAMVDGSGARVIGPGGNEFDY